MELPNFTKKSKEPAAPGDRIDLELPDWSGMDDSSVRITPHAAFRLCEHYPLLLRKNRADVLGNRSEPCIVEFVL
jgi:hypothetical protein